MEDSPPPEKENRESSDLSPVRPHNQPDSQLGAGRDISQVMAITSSIYRSPLPPPEILKGYDLVQPGFAERVFLMAETQAKHRQELERTVVRGDRYKSWFGLFLGFFVASGVFYGSYDLVKKGHDTAGTLLGGSVLASIVGIFVYGSNQRTQERVQKSRTTEDTRTNDNKEDE